MRRALVVAAVAAVVAVSSPGSAAAPGAEPPAPPADELRGTRVLPLPPPSQPGAGCVVPVGGSALDACPRPRRTAPPASCVLPLIHGTQLLRCPTGPRPPDRGWVVPLQSLTLE
ncbi:hypothetical protein [Nocardioides coralli]|uniref:hypothetical protein n=1 Tax=Nocardioides coralli TaxID=2872154 RepID=UPI001CA3F3FF|nr:hypothetical protein [Nocardioides coralli]QZY27677.1 hypothetical protein K6T13_09090 [Nocardioides coralli]